MVDLKTLNKEELIREFDFILSEWEKCKKVIQSCNQKISELNLNERKSVYAREAFEKVARERGKDELSALIKQEQKKFDFFIKVVRLLIGLIFMFLWFMFGFKWSFLFLLILAGLAYRFPEKLFNNAKIRELKRKEYNILIEQENERNKEYGRLRRERESLEEKIKDVNREFQEFCSKRNNLPQKYRGYEGHLKSYLEIGTADDLKEAYLRLDEHIYREKMLNNRR